MTYRLTCILNDSYLQIPKFSVTLHFFTESTFEMVDDTGRSTIYGIFTMPK